MTNNNNKNRVGIHLYMDIPVSDELWDELWEDDNDNAIRKIANKYGFVLMTDKEAENAPEGTPLIVGMDDADSDVEFYLA